MANRKPAGPATKSKNRQTLLVVIGAALCCAVLWGNATAQVVVNPANGHFYEYVRIRGFVTWDQARDAALARGGYLATVTDSVEAGFVAGLLGGPTRKAFLGASDTNDSCDWLWVTGEPFTYTNWAPGEPSGEEPCENSLRTSYELHGKWEADVGPLDGWIMEWNSVPTDALQGLIQWPLSEGGNGHWYALLPISLPWNQARDLAGQFNQNGTLGHLATITSEAENVFIANNIVSEIPAPDDQVDPVWLGGYDDSAWVWITGEPFSYTNWGLYEPGSTPRPALAMIAPPQWGPNPSDGKWLAIGRSSSYPAVVEFDTDPTPLLGSLTQWPASEGGNDHWYAIMRITSTWDVARHLAGTFTQDGEVGHLATITSESENDFITELIMPDIVPTDAGSYAPGFWLGGFAADQWLWITGEPFAYSHFLDSVPFDSGNVIAIRGYSDWMDTTMGFWDSRSPQCDPAPYGCLSAVIEFDTEPQIDTLVDLVQWPVSEGGNGHWYAYLPKHLSWDQARSVAATFERNGVPGHLATITSQQENQFVFENIALGGAPSVRLLSWMGGYDDSAWAWVTGEPFEYTNWGYGHPNAVAFDWSLAMVGPPWFACIDCPHPGQWVSQERAISIGSIVEFDTEPQIDTLVDLVQWPVSEGGNGHWYAYLPPALPWEEARNLATTFEKDGVPGHLVSITSQAENDFVLSSIILGDSLGEMGLYGHQWIGLYDDTGWTWVTGEISDYYNWGYMLDKEGSTASASPWVSVAMVGLPFLDCPLCPQPGQWLPFSTTMLYGSIVEFDTPPVGPRTLHVPADYATIQAAIDAARDGTLILVSPGIYHESITYRGKDVVVRSTDGPEHTVITNERTVNLVRFQNGETNDAVLEGFTLQGGWIAVLINNSAPTIRRNLCVGQNVWNWAAVSISGPIDTVVDYYGTGDPRYIAHPGYSPAVILNNTIVNSSNGGMYTWSTVPPTIRNNIVAFNANYGIAQQVRGDAGSPIVGYNDVYGQEENHGTPFGNYINIPDPGPGSISLDPLFDTRPFAASWSLSAESPCINAGDPDPAYNDPDGSRNDMGALPFVGEGPVVIPTNEWIVVYCDVTRPDVYPVGTSGLIQAFDPSGILCGQALIHWTGTYGLMPIYRDDPYTDIDEGCEPGDLVHFRIDGVQVQPDQPVYWTANGDLFEVCEFGQSQCVNIPLHTGWNLVSWNVAFQGEITTALDVIIGCVDVVMSYEQGGLIFDPGLDGYNTLTHLDYDHGYWIRMNCDAVLQVCGDPIDFDEWIELEPGWNLVSYWPEGALPTETGFFSIMDSLQMAMGFDQGAQIWLPDFGMNTLTELKPSSGYWVRVSGPMPLVYPQFEDPDTILTVPANPGPSALVETSREWMSVYGSAVTVDGLPVAEGAVFEFRAGDDILCGRGVYSGGRLKLTPVYGWDDSGELSKRFPKAGDGLQIWIDGARAYPGLVWNGGDRVRLSQLTTDSQGLPDAYALSQNYPNPFNPETIIAYEIPIDAHVTLAVYNVLGQRVRTLMDAKLPAGRYEALWNGRDDDGRMVSTGVYLYRLIVGEVTLSRKMLLLK